MGLVILGFIGFILATLIGLAWAVVWIAFALFWLVWPLVLLVVAGIAWRRQARGWQRAQRMSTEAPQRQPSPESGNAAFDAYRADTVQQLDEERARFGEFLERLRKAKDKEAFDSYMADRRGAGGHIEDMRGASA
jgi:hypothetical protein